ncbi:hypothetical protein [Nonomuraea sp. NPDC003709]|uniref:hypothetical protein n=1 Tax=Nonomuraea sp. NPDC003709 TaxID=3154450 RepID=UPI00339F27DB
MIRTDGRQQVALVLLCAAVLVTVTTLGESVLAGYRIAFVTVGGFSLAGALIAAYGLRSRRPVPVPTA